MIGVTCIHKCIQLTFSELNSIKYTYVHVTQHPAMYVHCGNTGFYCVVGELEIVVFQELVFVAENCFLKSVHTK